MQNQVRELFERKVGIRKIAQALKISRNTVRSILRELEKTESPALPEWARAINWDHAKVERQKGASYKVLHSELAPAVTYKVFWHGFRRICPDAPETTIRIEHKPGEKAFFDFADGIDIVDRFTGEITSTELLMGVLPFSSLTAGEFVLNQKQPTLIAAMENVFFSFGGTTPYVTVDNLRSAVSRSHIYDPDVNLGFTEFANHWGFAVLPARPYKPKDKAAVESAIGVIQRQFYQEVRNTTFYSLAELNAAFKQYLCRLNSDPMKDHCGVTRQERFGNEKNLLRPLPLERFETAEWKTCKVHPDCHIQVQSRFYSVPYNLVGATLNVRIKSKTVEIFTESREPVVVHARLFGTERASTRDEHYPQEKVALARFEVKSARRQAEQIGPEIQALVEDLLNSSHPLKYLRRVQGILRLYQSGQVKRESLEYAAKKALLFGKKQLGYVKAAALFHQAGGGKPHMATPARNTSEIHLHQNPQPRGDTP